MIEIENVHLILNEIIVKKDRIRIEIIQDSLTVELPSFEDIEREKRIGIEQISISTIDKYECNVCDMLEDSKIKMQTQITEFSESAKFLYRLSTVYEQLGDLVKALEYAEKATKISTEPIYLVKYGTLLLKNSDDKGIKILEQVDTEDALVNLAILRLQRGEWDAMLELARTAYEKFDYSQKISLTFSLALMVTGNYKESIVVLKNMSMESDYSSSAYFLKSMCYLVQGQYQKSYDSIRIAYGLNRSNKDILLLYSNLCEKRQEYKKSIAALEGILPLDNGDVRIWEDIARNYYKFGSSENAQKALQAILAIDDTLGWVWNNLAIIAVHQKNYARANKLFIQSMKQSVDSTVLMNYMAFLFSQEQYEVMIALYNSFIKIHETSRISDNEFRAFEFYLNALKKLSRYIEYGDAIEKMYKINEFSMTSRISLLNYLICFYCTDGENREKGEAYLNTIESILETTKISKDEYARTINNIVFAYLEFNDVQNAQRYIKQLASRLDESPFMNATYGLYLFCINQGDRGELYYEKALSFIVEPSAKDVISRKRNLEIGKFQLREKNFDSAKRFLVKAVGGIDFITHEAKRLLAGL